MAAALVVLAVGILADHASAGVEIADLKIAGNTGGKFKKNDKYTSEGLSVAKQTVSKTVEAHDEPVPKFRSFYVKSQLDGADQTTIKLLATPDAPDCFLVFYSGPGFNSDENVTGAITGAGIEHSYQPGKSRKWRIEIGAANGCDPGDQVVVEFIGRTPPALSDDDVVRARLEVT